MPSENPLFTNDIAPTLRETSVSDDENVGSVNDNSSIDNNFWFPSDTPDALNELPDLEGDNAKPADDNFFANDLGGLNFPDLKVDFGNNDTEEK